MAGILIRRARAADASAVCALVRELAAGDGESTPITARTVTAYLRNTSCRIFVAVETRVRLAAAGAGPRSPAAITRSGTASAGGVVAMVSFSFRPSLFHAGKSCLIEELVVTAAHRGRGIGRNLVSRAVQEAEKAGCAEISVSTEKDNRPAIELYRSRGLKEEYLYLEKHF